MPVYSFGSVVKKWPSISCQSTEYKHAFPIYLILLLVVIIGVPSGIMYLVIHLKRKNTIFEPETEKRYGILYSGYRHEFFFWEPIILIRRVTIVCLTATIIQSSTMYMAICVINILLLFVHMKCSPFQDAAYCPFNLVESISLAVLCIISALLINAPIPNPENYVTGFAFLVYFPACSFLLYILIFRLRNKCRNSGSSKLKGDVSVMELPSTLSIDGSSQPQTVSHKDDVQAET